MEGTILFRLEIFIFFSSLGYILYYLGEKAYHFYVKLRHIVTPTLSSKETVDTSAPKKHILKVSQKDDKVDLNSYTKEKNLSEQDKEKLVEIIKRVKVNSSKGYYETAKSSIIEGLAIDKYNTDLNLELAHIYEEEKNYKNAEYIYRDLMQVQKSNINILKRLGYILAVQRRFKEAIGMYEKAYEKNHTDLETIELLIDLHYEIGNYDDAFKYIIISLKEKPRNIERMMLKAELLTKKGKEEEAIGVYKKILEIQPYHTEALDFVRAAQS